jgi:ethanolamine utilization protein EutN
MLLGNVVGEITSTIHHRIAENRKLLIVDKVTPEGTPSGEYLIAIDTVEAGRGETVLLIDEGNSARQVLNAPNAPVRSVIVGIIDHIEI